MQIQGLANKIKRKESELFLLECIATSTTAATDREAVQTSSTSDKVGNSAAKILDLKAEIEQEKVAALEQIKECIATIEQVRKLPIKTAQTQYDILHLKYVSGKKLKYIAYKLNYDYDYIRELHGRALKNVQMLLNKQNKKRAGG